VSLSNLKQLGDGVIELDITLKHPFSEPLIYSVFDVKGVIIFDASLKASLGCLTYYTYPEIYPAYISWAKRGDWELINPDGYTWYWSPEFNPDSEWAITHYLPGKFSQGTPTGRVNAYRNFYTDEERHLFRAGHSVMRTYRIQTQPGPMVVGYAIDASWEPPNINPVSNPLTDFPSSANQQEPYFFDVVLDGGEVITEHDQLCGDNTGVIKIYIEQWNDFTVTKIQSQAFYEIEDVIQDSGAVHDYYSGAYNDTDLIECNDGSSGDEYLCGIEYCYSNSPSFAGWYRVVSMTNWGVSGEYYDFAVDITDFYYDP